MLKTRVIGVVLVKSGLAVQSIGFRRYLPIGSPEIAIEYLDRWGIDEIAVLHINAHAQPELAPTPESIRSYSRYCQVPLAIGGGFNSLEDLKTAIQAGADKVVLNQALFTRPQLITEGASLLGNQAIVVSIDAKRNASGGWEVFTHSGTQTRECDPLSAARKAESLGAGEILLTSIDQDGSKAGMDSELFKTVAASVRIPVIGCGGAGHPEHLLRGIESGVAAVAAGNFFHFSEHSVITSKRYLRNHGASIRFDSNVNYAQIPLSGDGRPSKQPDEALQALRFRYIPEERI